ncbi:uncharacterized protein LOC62_03G004054 [Vanrija pseudolonga]|uniref:PSI domain-containing protein n=1 Tax=Vanrija pseudolonga TaxID=143232 RepID=A0AAF0Y5U7_9TREE|nr:hypothetical protein LOC62_03G004054 [Vanrija pseudolonga]
MIIRLWSNRLPALLVLLSLLVACVQASASSAPAAIYARSPQATKGKPSYVPRPASDLVCRPLGECEPCPADELNEPFCKPFGNRRVLHCIPANASEEKNPIELPAWEACGKVIKKEQRSFYEFVTANLLLLIVCLTIYGVRTSTLAAQQYRQLAARIGIPSGRWEV